MEYGSAFDVNRLSKSTEGATLAVTMVDATRAIRDPMILYRMSVGILTVVREWTMVEQEHSMEHRT